MTFHASPFLITFSASVICPTFIYSASLSNIFSRCFPPVAFSLDHSNCHKMFKFLIIWPKKVAWLWRLYIVFTSDLVVWGSCNIVSPDFFEVNDICCILCRNHISVSSSFFCSYLDIVQAVHH